jgi:hypothetical protein
MYQYASDTKNRKEKGISITFQTNEIVADLSDCESEKIIQLMS